MDQKRRTASLGLVVYGASAVMLGVLGLVWSDFAGGWQRVPADVPHRTALALVTAVCEIAGGAAVLGRRWARAGALLLAMLYLVFALSWMGRVAADPRIYDSWGNVFEELALVMAGLMLFASQAAGDEGWARRRVLIRRLYGVCVVSFGLDHFFYLSGAASFVPRWIPPGQRFWAVATAVFFLMAAAAILSGVLAGLASRLLTAMIVGFGVLVWAPKLIAAPHSQFMWAGNAINAALAGAAWVMADAINGERQLAAERELELSGADGLEPASGSRGAA